MKKFTDIINENKVEDNNKVLEAIDTQRTAELYELAGNISGKIGEMLATPLTNEEMSFVIGKIKADLDDFMDNYEGESFEDKGEDINFQIPSYNTSNLEEHNIKLGELITQPEQLVVDNLYCIADDERWTGGWLFTGKHGNIFVFTDSLMQSGDTYEFTDSLLLDMLEKGKIALQA